MKRSIDRRKNIQQQMDKHQINFEFIEAVDGNQLTKEQLARVDNKLATRRLSGPLSKRQIGCALSHANIYQKIVDEKIQNTIILEDDVIISDDFVKHLKLSTFSKLGYDFLSLYCGCEIVDKEVNSFDNYKIYNFNSNVFGAVAYYLNYKAGIELSKVTKIISCYSDFPIHLGRICKAAIIKPNIINYSTGFKSTISMVSPNSNKIDIYVIKNRIRRYSMIEYFLNPTKYLNFKEFIKDTYFLFLLKLYRSIKNNFKK